MAPNAGSRRHGGSDTARDELLDAARDVLSAVEQLHSTGATGAARLAALEGIDRLRDGLIAALHGDEPSEVRRLARSAADSASESMKLSGV